MIFKEKEIYTLNGAYQDLPGFDDKYHNIVDYILKITEEIWEQRAIWVIYDTYEKDVLIHSGAETIQDVESVVSGTIKTLSSFPDRKMNGEAVIWSRSDNGEFFSSHRISSTATNLGPTPYGDATGKRVFFRTIADCAIRENKIFEEWLVRDNLHLIMQLGFDPVEMAKRDTTYQNGIPSESYLSSNFSTNVNGKTKQLDLTMPERLINDLYNNIWANQKFDQLEDFYNVLATTHAICENKLVGPQQLKEYLVDLFASFSNIKFEVQRITSNELDQETEIAVRWKMIATHSGDGFFSSPSGKEIIMPGICHYIVKDGKINEEWIVFDGYDVLLQIYANVKVENATLPIATDVCDLNNKQNILSFIEELNTAGNSKKYISEVIGKYVSQNVQLNVTKPFKEINGKEGFTNEFWLPMIESLPDLENQPYILIGGRYEGRDYVSHTGNLIGTWKKDWLGIPATNQPTWLRYSTTYLIEKNKIIKAWYFFDMLDVLRQAGFNFILSRGIDWVPPIPMTGDGIVNYPIDKIEGQKTLDLTNAMLDALGEYDGKTLDSMAQERFWDKKNMMWYGPSGIGTTRGLKGFQDNHQLPFLLGFPDRGIIPKIGKDYFAQIGDGHYSCDFGFPAMYGTHNGDGWLGLKATGKKVTLRVVDYWRREGDKLKENWVFIDLIDALEQLGVNIFKLLEIEKESGP